MVLYILFSIGIVIEAGLGYTLWNKIKNQEQLNTVISEKNKIIEEQFNSSQQSLSKLNQKLTNKQEELKTVETKLMNVTTEMEKSLKSQNDIIQNAFNSYSTILDKAYEDRDREFDDKVAALEDSYKQKKENLLSQLDNERKELDKIKQMRAAAQEAILREKQIKEQSSFYCLQLTDSQKADIKFLQEIEVRLSQPRVLRMLVWQYYFQKPLKSLWANILGGKEVTGVYKITNQITSEVYIGQAINIQKRWSEHAKCGLGIDTPTGNKLYAAMKEYGLDAFSWELLEECKSELLNEKERKYIELYDSVNYGYNSQKGNK